MEIRNKNFFSEISAFMAKEGKNVVLAVIDESDIQLSSVARTKDVPEPSTQAGLQQRWNNVTATQLKLLSFAAENTACTICEITFGGASTQQINAILTNVPPGRLEHFSKREANALKDDAILAYVKKAPEHWVVMGYHTNACIASTCGVTPLSEMEGNQGLLQFGKKIYTGESVLHPEGPSPFWWAAALKSTFTSLHFYFDMTAPTLPPPPPDD